MADWRFRGIHCLRCKQPKQEPVNLHDLPYIYAKGIAGVNNDVYIQQCHACSMVGVSHCLSVAYEETWKRLIRLCEQKEKAGVQ